MMFNVPQYIDIEDKVAGPFTAKQLGWMMACGGILFVLYSIFELVPFIILTIPIVLFFAALAFYKPNGQPFIKFLFHAVLFLFRPKIAIWERPVRQMMPKKEEPIAPMPKDDRKKVTITDLNEIAKMMDSRR
ncbi:MAG: PrgI family protein [Candidatus Moranbacteria bacterium]|nr:PrgI family protein [Candidatus Moranbacteria bacterium]